MKRSKWMTVMSAVIFGSVACWIGGCDAVDYYPNNEANVTPTDNEKAGESGIYGGFDSTVPVYHPKALDNPGATSPSTGPSTAPAVTTVRPAPNGVVFHLGLVDGADNPDTGTYGGSNVAGGTSGYAANDPADNSKYSPADPGR